ncbi:hypothetical protein BA177_16050 [Woeseia oceani]|uniref:DUF2167 domain-containing protein n=1 Tax=Woeseia oceani TaxID=1548547 RepID=A0A193LIZ2_9GAMM|nr:hypothetical protein BA177_16050 [Woeseia oceani]
MSRLVTTLSALLLLPVLVGVAQEADEYSAEEVQAYEALQRTVDALQPRTGTIVLADGLATLRVPDDFYFLDAADAKTVLVDVWGNPPGQVVLGLLLPARYSPLDYESWAVTIAYIEDGHVSDDDAAEIDFTALLRDMQADMQEASDARVADGYSPVELLGWAEAPHYDASAKKLYWAKELRFGGTDETTLNYEIRALGRLGILSFTFVAATGQLEEVNASRDAVLAMTEFNAGHRYTDFDPGVDKQAVYGIGALITGKLIVKAGVFAGMLEFLKKFGVYILLAIALMWRRFMRLFSSDKSGPQS